MNKIIDAQLEAYKKLDAKGMMPYFHKDVEMFLLNGNTLTDSGHEAVLKKYENFFKKSPNLKFNLIGRMEFKDFVVDHESLEGFLDKSEPVEALVIYQVEENLIRRVWIGV